MRSAGTELALEIKPTDWSMAGNLSNRSSGVQIPRDICTRLKRYLYSAKCSWIIKALTLYILSTCIRICSHIKFPIFVLPSFGRFSFFFPPKQDDFRVKVAFVSTRFVNASLRTSYFSTIFNSKYTICCLSLSWMTKQVFNINIQISLSSQGRPRTIFLTNINFENCSIK